MKIKILKDLRSDPKEGVGTSSAGVELTSVDGLFTLETTDEEIGEEQYSYTTNKTVFTKSLALDNPDLFEVIEEKANTSSNIEEPSQALRSTEEIRDKIEAIKEDLALLEDMARKEDMHSSAFRYILSLNSMKNILEWVISPENQA